MTLARWAAVGAAVLLFGACGPCGGTAPAASSSGNGCAHPGICLTLKGLLSGKTSGLVQPPDCIAGGGLDMEFTTHVGDNETSIEILVVDPSAKPTPGFRGGSYAVKSRGSQSPGAVYASIFIKPDKDVGSPGGFSTDTRGSGTVVLNADESGSVENAVVAPKLGQPGFEVNVSGTFNCR